MSSSEELTRTTTQSEYLEKFIRAALGNEELDNNQRAHAEITVKNINILFRDLPFILLGVIISAAKALGANPADITVEDVQPASSKIKVKGEEIAVVHMSMLSGPISQGIIFTVGLTVTPEAGSAIQEVLNAKTDANN